MNMLVLVRSRQDLARTRSDLSDFFALRWQLSAEQPHETLLGIWVAPMILSNPPSVLTGHNGSGSALTVPITETVALSGLWTICWIDDSPLSHGDSPATRLDLLSLLCDPANQAAPVPADGPFVPVFSLAAPRQDTQAEIDRLAATSAHLLLPPWYQDPSTGRLVAPGEGL